MDFIRRVLKATEQKRQQKTVILEEYEEVEQVPPAPGDSWAQHDAMVRLGLCEAARKHEIKNRYCNLFPFDKDIVRLPGDTYINASWLQLNGFKYIVTMGPMHPSSYGERHKYDVDVPADAANNTCPDFWKMIWHTDAKIVVMLCELAMGFSGCSKYFPTDMEETQVHGDYRVTCAQVKADNDNFVERELKLAHDSSSQPIVKTVTHLQFKTWPNYGVPEGPKAIAGFVEYVRDCAEARAPGSKDANPRLVVHCSGGIGRSGTFLTAFDGFDKIVSDNRGELESKDLLDSNGAISFKDTVWYLRKTRHPWMVEGAHQYLMAYDIAIQLLKNRNSSVTTS